MSKHSPGPWRLDDQASPVVSSANGAYVAQVLAYSDGTTGSLRPEAHADACLIEAAPDLLAAAQNTLRYYEATDPGRRCLIDNLNPCGGLAHWGKGIGCPLCSARAATAWATERAA